MQTHGEADTVAAAVIRRRREAKRAGMTPERTNKMGDIGASHNGILMSGAMLLLFI